MNCPNCKTDKFVAPGEYETLPPQRLCTKCNKLFIVQEPTMVDKSLEAIRQTSCLTDEIDVIENYIEWLECMIMFGSNKDYSEFSREKIRKEYSGNE